MLDRLVRPARVLSRSLNFRQKFLLVFLVSVLPGLVLLVIGALNNFAEIRRDKVEIAGARYLEAVSPVAKAFRAHRAATTRIMTGDSSADEALQASASDADQALAKLLVLPAEIESAPQLRGKVESLQSRWRELNTGWRKLGATESFNAHSALIGEINEYRHHVAGDTGLLLDPESSAYYQMVILTDDLPALREGLGKVRGMLTGLKAESADLASRLGRVDLLINDVVMRSAERVDNNLELLGDQSPQDLKAVASGWTTAKQEIDNLRSEINSQLLQRQVAPADGKYFYDRITLALDHLSQFDKSMLKRLTEETLVGRLKVEQQALMLRVVVGLSVMALVGWLIIGFARDIATRADILKQGMKLIADGDFTHSIDLAGRDELCQVGHSANELMAKLSISMRNIQQGSAELMDAASSIASASGQVANTTHEQSNAAAAMAAAVEQLTVSIGLMAESAGEAHSLSDDSGRTSSEGGLVINQTVESIELIAQSVREASGSVSALGRDAAEISGIVMIIKDIAGQTNLLALNAAIEAARAGDEGRGFAVVADEVRKLAERTASCTQQIAQMIDRIQAGTNGVVGGMETGVGHVERGVELAGQAGLAIERIREGSTEVIGAVSEITNALKEQSAAAHQVATKVEAIALMSEQNSQAAESSAATAEQLRALAQSLERQVNIFKFA
ncbi:methyl-accepting chemotaxis protein [Chitinimonas naiadis]